jgi:copper transport protein
MTRAQAATPVVSTQLERDPLLAMVGRLLVLSALIGIVGSLAVARWIVLPGIRHPLRRIGQAEPAPAIGVETALATAVRRTWAIAAAVGGVGLVLGVAAILIRVRSANVQTLLTGTRTGHVTLVVLAAVAICAVAARTTTFQLERPPALIGASMCAVALVAISAGGHATAGRDALLSGAFDAVHMIATAIWIGGLIVLLAIWRALRAPGDDTTVGRLGAIVVRFSGVAVVCVATLAVTGTYRALGELASFGDLIDTPYGRALTVKLVLFGLLLVMGAINRFVVHPRLERAGIGLSDSDRGAGRLLGPSVRIELALAGAVLVSVAVMIGFPPPG